MTRPMLNEWHRETFGDNLAHGWVWQSKMLTEKPKLKDIIGTLRILGEGTESYRLLGQGWDDQKAVDKMVTQVKGESEQ